MTVKTKPYQNIAIDIYSLSGRKELTLLNTILSTGIFDGVFDLHSLKSGTHLLRVKTVNEQVTQNIVLVKK